MFLFEAYHYNYAVCVRTSVCRCVCPVIPLYALYSYSLFLNSEVVQVLPNVGGVNDTLEAAYADVLMDLTETTKAPFNWF